jgi:hypothetical protein
MESAKFSDISDKSEESKKLIANKALLASDCFILITAQVHENRVQFKSTCGFDKVSYNGVEGFLRESAIICLQTSKHMQETVMRELQAQQLHGSDPDAPAEDMFDDPLGGL